ncbi:serine acetyltransferase [Hanamia caeni]|jgi:serine O-acetyltransferase|uniref:Serine acetyltransferase n=1 Tax=Hanamia caeni TaxID=2294116 RepID=A0A3M9NMR0_9BACT|nr:serine O-acetyltransferase EpsC [Hanamia caeni]RNI39079.1 serine acetyltransferase [Hanamia caeni]
MTEDFLRDIYLKQRQKEQVPSNKLIANWALNLICLLYPEMSKCSYPDMAAIQHRLSDLSHELKKILDATRACTNCDHEKVSADFFEQLPEIFRVLNTDIDAIHRGDPAAKSKFEVIRAYPGFYALCFYRIAHALHLLDVPLIPRILTEYAHSKTGIDIHPAAKIGEYFMMDHGTGIVIGETSVIGKNVKMYQGVTLGGLSIKKAMSRQKRHPNIEDNVIIYSNATILGGDTLVGEGSVIGGNVWLTQSVPPGSLVITNPQITIVENKFVNNNV